MAFEGKRIGGFGLLAVLSSAVLVYFGGGVFPWWPLMWLAPVPVLLFAVGASWWGGALVAFMAWFLGSLNLWPYFQSVLHLPIGVQAVIFGVPAALFALAVLLFRALVRRGAWWSAVIAFPAAWVTFEYLANLVSPHGTGGSLSYSQLNFLPFLQVASVAGPWGMSFLLLFFSSALVVVVHLWRLSRRTALQILGAAWGLIAVALIFGAVRLWTPIPGARARVGLVSSDEPVNVDVPEGAAADRLFHDYGVRVEELAARGAQVVVLPEKLAVVLDSEHDKTDKFFQSLADRTKAIIVVGVVYVAPADKYNRARVYTPDTVVQSYDKHHMLPPFESNLTRGTSLTLIARSSVTWGVEICKDMDFTALSRKYGRAGAGLMLVPGWDFVMDRFAHGHMAVMRGVEDGFSIARTAKQGYLTAADDRGRVLAETRSDSAPFASVLAEVPDRHETTVYLRWGDWFAWVACAMLAACHTALFRR